MNYYKYDFSNNLTYLLKMIDVLADKDYTKDAVTRKFNEINREKLVHLHPKHTYLGMDYPSLKREDFGNASIRTALAQIEFNNNDIFTDTLFNNNKAYAELKEKLYNISKEFTLHPLANTDYMFVSKKLNKIYLIPKSDKQIATMEIALLHLRNELRSRNAKDRKLVFDEADIPFTYSEFSYSEYTMNILTVKSAYDVLNNNVSLNSTMANLRDLWVIQSKSLNLDREIAKDNRDAEFILKYRKLASLLNYLNASLSEKVNARVLNITRKNLIDFYNEVQEGTLTDKTLPVQNWLGADDMSSLRDILMDDKKISEKLSRIGDDYDFDSISNELNKDEEFSKYYRLVDVFSVNDDYPTKIDKRLEDSDEYVEKLVIHGTSSVSILSILLRGLKTSKQLQNFKKDNYGLDTKYHYSGSALGVGVYFSRLEQVRKSLNFIDGKQYNFLFLCKIRYRKNRVGSTNRFGYSPSKAVDLVHAHAVGFKGMDELMIPDTNNIAIQKLLVISKKEEPKRK